MEPEQLELDDLGHMHLMLREHGWVPELETENGPDYWYWEHPEKPRLGGLHHRYIRQAA